MVSPSVALWCEFWFLEGFPDSVPRHVRGGEGNWSAERGTCVPQI